MTKTLLVEIAGDSRHFVVGMPEAKGRNPTTELAMTFLSPHVAQFANVIIDPDRRAFIKSRYVVNPREVSYHELDWFMRGDVHHVTNTELKEIVNDIHGHR